MKAVFLDRDGTIARDVQYCRRVEDFELLPFVPQAIRLLNQHGFKVVVITNQSGIGRGYFTEETLFSIHQFMRQELARYGAFLDAVFYCPHRPDDICRCRKPRPGLLIDAAKQFSINLSDSFIIGDHETDIIAGKAAGCRSILLTDGSNNKKIFRVSPDCIAQNMLHAARWIIESASRYNPAASRPDDLALQERVARPG